MLVDGQEQRVLAVRTGIKGSRCDVRAIADRGDGERIVASFLEQLHAGVEHAVPRLAAAPLHRGPDLQ